MSNSTQPIDLAAQRVIALNQGERAYTFTVRRAEKQDWFRYFEGVRTTSEVHGRELLRTVEAGGAAVELVQALLMNAEGYGENIRTVENWQQKIPMRHRLGVADVLLDVRAVDAGADAVPEFGLEVVGLECFWSADEKGRMRRHRVFHTFETPSPDQYKAYLAAASTSRVVGGSRAGKTIQAGAQKTLCALYDELIVTVEGYGRLDTSESRAEIAQWMDCRHKVAAAERLFAAEQVEEVGGGRD